MRDWIGDPRILWFISALIGLSAITLLPFQELFPYLGWRYLHLISAALFSGIVVVSALIEWITLRSGDPELIRSYHQLVGALDKTLVTMSLTLLLISALALLALQGYSLWRIQDWPQWAWVAFLLLSALGVFWGGFDIKNQADLHRFLDSQEPSSPSQMTPQVKESSWRGLLMRRLCINLISVLILPILYYLMVFKPL